jgi:hypothetical protein
MSYLLTYIENHVKIYSKNKGVLNIDGENARRFAFYRWNLELPKNI